MKVQIALGAFDFANFRLVRGGDPSLGDAPVPIVVKRRGWWPFRRCTAQAPEDVPYADRTHLTAALLELRQHMRYSILSGQHTICLEWSYGESVGSKVLWDRYLARQALEDIARCWDAECIPQSEPDGERYMLAAAGAYMSWHITNYGVAVAITTRNPETLRVPLTRLHMIFDGCLQGSGSDEDPPVPLE